MQIPSTASPHDVAATLLAFFASLPSPFMPPAAAQVCDVCVPSASAAASLLADSLSPVEWAVFRHVSGKPTRNVRVQQRNGMSSLQTHIRQHHTYWYSAITLLQRRSLSGGLYLGLLQLGPVGNRRLRADCIATSE